MRNVRSEAVLAWAIGLSLSCGGEPGSQGPKGDPGQMGDPGRDATAMLTDCPLGYARDQAAMSVVLCKKGVDEVVRVGKGGSAFWIDRYEASIWEKEDGGGMQYGGRTDGDYPAGFAKNGQVTTALYAASVRDVYPSRHLTWFQASEACRASGKRLPTGDEWLAAARGTFDPGANDGANGACVTMRNGLRTSGGGTKCASDWGAEDMIGNILEFTSEWMAGVGTDFAKSAWPADLGASYGEDVVVNVASVVDSPPRPVDSKIKGFPAVAQRGGFWYAGTGAGIFSLWLTDAPTSASGVNGFRCVVPR